MTDLLEREQVERVQVRHAKDRRVWFRVGVPMVAALVLVVGAVLWMTRPASSPYDVLPDIAEYASQAGLTGLSPASLHEVPAVDFGALARWADEHGYTGLSPASLVPTDNEIRYLVNPGNAAMSSEIARYANQVGLSGLSPASLSPIEANPYSILPEIAAWADENGLSGLSPASLHP